MNFNFTENSTTIKFSFKERFLIFFRGKIYFDKINLIKFENALVHMLILINEIIKENPEFKKNVIQNNDTKIKTK